MADRTVKVTLTAAVNGYLSGLEQARKATKKTSDEGKKDLEAQGRAFGELGTIALGVGVLAAAGIALAVARFAEFDQAISNVKAATQETTENMDLLTDAALKFGASSVFTATEAANAIEELGKAGISTADILGGALEASLNLASAGELGIARAAEIAATTLKQFGLAGVDAARVADILAAGAGKSLGSVEDLAQGLKFVGPVAAAMGVSLEETTGVLALFAEQGIIGEQAGTALRGMLSSLTSPSKAAADEMEKLGIQLYDQSGAFLGVENAAGQLNSAFGGLTAEQRDFSLGVLFGNQQITAARVLYASGAEGVAKWTDAVSDSGYAAQVARDRLDNLKGDVEALGGAFDTYLIRTGSGANEVLRGLTQSLTFLVEGLGGMPEETLNVGLAFGVVATAMLLVGGSALVAIPKFAALRATVAASGISMSTLAVRTAAAGGALGLATIVLGVFIASAAEARANASEFADTLDEATGATTKYTREMAAKKLAENGAFETAKKLGISQKELTDALIEGGDELDAVQGKLREYSNSSGFGDQLGFEARVAEASIRELRGSLEDGAEQFENLKASGDDSVKTLDELANTGNTATDAVAELSNELRDFGNVTFDVIDAEQAFYEAIDAVTGRLGEDGFAGGLDQASKAGRENMDVLTDIAKSTNDFAAATRDSGGSVEDLNTVLTEGSQKLYDAAIQFGATEEEARSYANQLIATPAIVQTRIEADTGAALSNVAALKRALASLPSVVITAEMREEIDYYKGRATGGAISGPGTGTSDTAGVFRLSNGEHVLTAADVQAMGGQSGVYAFRNQLKGYATGGAVQYAPPTPNSFPSAGFGSEGMGTKRIEMNVTAEDPQASAALVYQRLNAEMVGL
jgi:TP901 family phage tail tape measure protein